MSDCQKYLETHRDKILETIRQTKEDDHEHAFAFGERDSTPVMLGNCDDVARPTMPEMAGTFHSHTIEYSHPSPSDIETFMNTPDKVMCVIIPKGQYWQTRCIDRSMGVCGELEL